MSVRLKLTVFLSILFITSIGNSLFFFILESNNENKIKWVTHTNEVIYTSERLLSSLKDAETGQRGYLITLNPSYLTPYYSGKEESQIRLNELKSLTSDNPEQQERLSTIEHHISLKNAVLAHTIALAEHDRIGEAIKIVLQDRGKLFMDKIRGNINEFIHAEEILLELRKSELHKSRKMMTSVIIVEIIFYSLFAILTFSFINERLFLPIKLLLSNTAKMKKGEKIDNSEDCLNDEMGMLLSSFYSMSKKVNDRERALHHRAIHDELTGLKNRATVFDEIDSAIKESILTNSKVVVFFLDLDKFKQINDSLGHDAGDIILKETASRLRSSIRSDDHVFRVGGDEFIILLKKVQKHSEINSIANDILDAFNEPVTIKGNILRVQPSIGIAISPDDAKNSEELLRHSDTAMYEVKNNDSQKYTFYNRNRQKNVDKNNLDKLGVS